MRPGSELGAAPPPEKEAEFPAVCSGGSGLLTPRNPPEKRRRLRGLTGSSVGSDYFLSYLGAGGVFFTSRGCRTANRAKEAAQAGGGEPPATGMARDYDYLFKLLIIGDSGKPTPGMQDGKWALPCFFLIVWKKKCNPVA